MQDVDRVNTTPCSITDAKGQSLMEFLIFLPFMLILYSVSVTLINAVNGSINQQKILRGYFYFSIQNDSMVPSLSHLRSLSGVNQTGMIAFGWKERFLNGKNPAAPCYRVNTFTEPVVAEACEEKIPEKISQYIRVKTAYGICGNNYVLSNDGILHAVHYGGQAGSLSACSNN